MEFTKEAGWHISFIFEFISFRAGYHCFSCDVVRCAFRQWRRKTTPKNPAVKMGI